MRSWWSNCMLTFAHPDRMTMTSVVEWSCRHSAVPAQKMRSSAQVASASRSAASSECQKVRTDGCSQRRRCCRRSSSGYPRGASVSSSRVSRWLITFIVRPHSSSGGLH